MKRVSARVLASSTTATGLAVLGGSLTALGCLLLLFWNDFLVIHGPSRSEAARTSQGLIRETMARVKTTISVGRADTFIYSCGRSDGFGPKQYQGGTTVTVSGVSLADREEFEETINAVGDKLAANSFPKGSWDVSVEWDSPTSMTGEVNASVDCINMTRW